MYSNLTSDFNKITQPNNISIELKEHQKTAIYAMSKIEDEGRIKVDNKIIETNIGILADKVGSGKSLMIVSLINYKRTPKKLPKINYGNQFICVKEINKNNTVKTNIIIVPHNLVNQWINFFKYSKLKVIKFNKKQDFKRFYKNSYNDEELIKMDMEYDDIINYDVAIVSANKYNEFDEYFDEYTWSRIFIDEVDSIKLPRFVNWNANFIWFITATPNGLRYIYKMYIRDIFRIMTTFVFNNILLKNDDNYVDASMKLPIPRRFIIECLTPKELKVIQNFLPQSIINMINAGNTKEAIEKLNCNIGTDKNIIQIVTKNIRDDLHNYEIKLESENKMITNNKDEQTKKINHIIKMIEKCKTRLKSIEEKITGLNDDYCPICMGEFDNPVLVNCCKNLFCFECIALALKNKNSCPFCREKIHTNDLNFIDNNDKLSKTKIKKKEYEKKPKIKILKEILQKNKNGKYLIFSNYSETFIKIKDTLKELNITYSILSGTNDQINKKINEFESGHINVLMLNAKYYGSGLNLQMATDVIMYHRFEKELEEQVIGRAQRLGRVDRLNVYYLLHDNEVQTEDNNMEDFNFFEDNIQLSKLKVGKKKKELIVLD